MTHHHTLHVKTIAMASHKISTPIHCPFLTLSGKIYNTLRIYKAIISEVVCRSTHFLLGSLMERPGVEGPLSPSLSSPLRSRNSSSSSSSSFLPLDRGRQRFFFLLRLVWDSSPTRALKQRAGSERNKWNCS